MKNLRLALSRAPKADNGAIIMPRTVKQCGKPFYIGRKFRGPAKNFSRAKTPFRRRTSRCAGMTARRLFGGGKFPYPPQGALRAGVSLAVQSLQAFRRTLEAVYFQGRFRPYDDNLSRAFKLLYII